MKTLITGGAGFIGSHIAERMLKKGMKVVVLDNLSSKSLWHVPKDIEFIKGDIRDLKTMEEVAKEVDFVFHEAAFISAVESFEKEEEALETNILGTLNVLKSGLKNKVKKVLFASSCAANDLLSPYAVSKMAGEELLKIFSRTYGLKSSSLRYFNVFGPRQNSYSPVIPVFLSKAMNNEDLEIYGTGEQTRDFVYVDEVVKANEILMDKGDGETFNIGSGNDVSIKDLAQLIIKLTNSKSKIVYEPERRGDILKSRADISRIKELGFKIEKSLEENLKCLITGIHI